MALSLKHKFTSPKADGGDNTIVRPSNWNDEHALTLTSQKLIGRKELTDGAAGEITLGSGLILDPTTGVLAAGAVGEIMFFPATTAPAGTMKANGVLLSRTTYAALWAYAQASGNIVSDALWTSDKMYGSFSTGDGSTTFRIPDVRGEFIRAWDDGRGIDTGRVLGKHQDSQNLAHTHTVTDPGHNHSISDPGHAHGVYDPGHTHGTSGSSGTGTESWFAYQNGVTTNKNVNGSGTGISIYGAGTGISIVAKVTGISIQSSGGTEARPNNTALLAVIRY